MSTKTCIHTATLAVRDWILNPVTWVASVIVAAGMAVSLWLYPAGSPAPAVPVLVDTAAVNGSCSEVVMLTDATVWAAPYRGGEAVPVDPKAVSLTGCREAPR